MDDVEGEYPTNQSPGLNVLENYGWYILISAIATAFLYKRYLGPLIVEPYMKRRDEAEYAAIYHKNPDIQKSRLMAREQSILRLQEKYKKDAEENKRKLEEKEARKRAALLQNDSQEGGYKLGSSKSDDKKSFKPEYNPLMGSGSSSNYRPPKKSACGKGGCG